jgi:hypothetical protein
MVAPLLAIAAPPQAFNALMTVVNGDQALTSCRNPPIKEVNLC